ncbi:MAG TPA: zinc-ribbon domain-containing protein [Longimicrobiales bacterium]|nr:zinc-ribbon domain-containing protein [Longimicrobiales bacterium]
MTSFTVHCTHCDTGFPVDPDKVPDGGVRARCTNCEGIFFVARPLEMPEPAASAVAVDEPGEPGSAMVTEPAAPAADVSVSEPYAVEEPDTVELDDSTPATDSAMEPVVEPAVEDEAEYGDVDLDDAGFGSFDDEVEAIDADVGAGEGDQLGGTTVLEDDEEDVAPVPTGFQFGQRDPHDKARRLARVLVSDMITYNPDRHAQALARGTLSDDFEDEIAKSWEEYVDQVGRDMAESTDYWTNALNDVLARGEKVF